MKKKLYILISIIIILILAFATSKIFFFNNFAVRDEVYHEILKDEEEREILEVTITLPKFKLRGKQAINNDLINGYIDEYREAMKINLSGKYGEFAMAKDSYQNYLNIYEDYSDNSIMFYLTCSYEILRFDDEIITIKFLKNSYVGGAHGNSVVDVVNFDLVNNKIVSLEDLFSVSREEYVVKLTELIDEKLQEMVSQDEDLYLFDDYKQSLEHAIHDSSFALLKDSLSFAYQLYDIAPYSTGIITVDVPISELNGYLK